MCDQTVTKYFKTPVSGLFEGEGGLRGGRLLKGREKNWREKKKQKVKKSCLKITHLPDKGEEYKGKGTRLACGGPGLGPQYHTGSLSPTRIVIPEHRARRQPRALPDIPQVHLTPQRQPCLKIMKFPRDQSPPPRTLTQKNTNNPAAKSP